MSPSRPFLLDSIAALVVACVWFGVPGWLAARYTRVFPFSRQSGALLTAPLFGMAVFGPPSAWLFAILPMGRSTLVAVWAAVVTGLVIANRRARDALGKNPEEKRDLRFGLTLGALALAGGLFACVGILPFEHDGALYVGDAIYDHGKVAFIDAIAREGLPPHNPVYSPGATAPLNYYFVWLLLAAEIRALTGISGWACDVGLTWLSAAMCIAVVGSVASRFAGARARAVVASTALLFSGSLVPSLSHAASKVAALSWLVDDPGGFEPASSQMTWVPQHVIGATSVVTLLSIAATLGGGSRPNLRVAATLGALGALAFGCSLWIAFALAVATPLLGLAVVVGERPVASRTTGPILTLVIATGMAFALSVPVLLAALLGPASPEGLPVALALYPISRVPLSPLAHVAAFAVVFVPASYGITILYGSISMRLISPTDDASRRFVRIGVASVVSFLGVSLALRSTVAANDLGWRAQIVAHILLAAFGGALVAPLTVTATEGFRSLGPKVRIAVGLLGAFGVVLGLKASWPSLPVAAADGSSELALRRRFAQQARAWQRVRELTAPTDVVQANPDAFTTLAPWPMNLPYMLFADRSSALGDERWSVFYSSRAEPELRAATAAIVRDVFSATPHREAIETLHTALHVRVVLIDRDDPGFRSDVLEQSGHYAIVESTEDYKIYRAVPPKG